MLWPSICITGVAEGAVKSIEIGGVGEGTPCVPERPGKVLVVAPVGRAVSRIAQLVGLISQSIAATNLLHERNARASRRPGRTRQTRLTK
jgi:hypothetical protein